MTRLMTALIALALLLPMPAAAQTSEIIRVIDGDTLEFFRFGWKHKLRLEGINTPETRGTCDEAKDVADAATRFVEDFVADGTAMVVTDGDTDSLNRRLGYVRKGKLDLAEELLKAGLATPYVEGLGDKPWCGEPS